MSLKAKGTPPSSPSKPRPSRSLSLKTRTTGSNIPTSLRGKGVSKKDDSESLSKKALTVGGSGSTRGFRGRDTVNASDLPVGLLFFLYNVDDLDGYDRYKVEEESVYRSTKLLAVTSSLIFEIEEMEVIAVERRNVKYRKKEGGSTLAIKVEKIRPGMDSDIRVESQKGWAVYEKAMKHPTSSYNPSSSTSSDPSSSTSPLPASTSFSKSTSSSSYPTARPVDIPIAPLFAIGQIAYQTQSMAERFEEVGEGWVYDEYMFGVSELGIPLSHAISSSTITSARQLQLFTSTYDAITSLHALGFVHQDLKEDNVIVKLKKGEDGVMMESDEVLLIDLASLEEEGKEWEKDDKVVLEAKGTPSYMASNFLMYYIHHLFQAADSAGLLKGSWTDDHIARFKGYLFSNTDVTVSNTYDLWSFGIIILKTIDPVYASRTLIDREEVSWYEAAFGYGNPAGRPTIKDFDTVISRCGAISRFFVPLAVSRDYLASKEGNGIVGDEIGSLLEKLFILPKNRSTFSNMTYNPSSYSSSLQPTFHALLSSKSSPKEIAGRSAASLASSMVKSPSQSLKSMSLDSRSLSGTSSLGSPRKQTNLRVKGEVDGNMIVFKFEVYERVKGEKVTRTLECPFDDCKNSTGSERWISSISRHEENLRRHYAPILSPTVLKNPYRCLHLQSAGPESCFGFQIIGEDGNTVCKYDGTSAARDA